MIPVESTVDLKLQIPIQREAIHLEGRVIACEEIKKNYIYAVRVAFINVSDEQKKALQEFVQTFLKM